ncbi:PulJ/GspJ family protein, partial [Nocardioides oceani]
MKRSLRHIRQDEDGFTLVEMLMAIAIGGIITTVIAGAFIVLIKTD